MCSDGRHACTLGWTRGLYHRYDIYIVKQVDMHVQLGWRRGWSHRYDMYVVTEVESKASNVSKFKQSPSNTTSKCRRTGMSCGKDV